jgi:hypothetical protein
VPADTRSDGAPASCAGIVYWQDEPRRLMRSAGGCPLAQVGGSITDSTDIAYLAQLHQPKRRWHSELLIPGGLNARALFQRHARPASLISCFHVGVGSRP